MIFQKAQQLRKMIVEFTVAIKPRPLQTPTFGFSFSVGSNRAFEFKFKTKATHL